MSEQPAGGKSSQAEGPSPSVPWKKLHQRLSMDTWSRKTEACQHLRGAECRLGAMRPQDRSEMTKLVCQDLFIEAPVEECFTANLKASRMFNI